MRLRDLGIGIGSLEPGVHNAITDVAGISVGHAQIGGRDAGVTAVVPYPTEVAERELFIGRWSADGGDNMTGLGVAEDFGTFSTPILLVPAPAVGRTYEALIAYGLDRDTGLSTDAGWPPIVVGLDDTRANSAAWTYGAFEQEHVAKALAQATSGAVAEGNAGIGGGLQAFGYKGGVGTASRRVGQYTVGALVAANGGATGDLSVDRYPVGVQLPAGRGEGPQDFAAILATDAPLMPRQLERLASRGGVGLARVGLWGPLTRTGLVLAFSTRGMFPDGGSEAFEPIRPQAADSSSIEVSEPMRSVGEEALFALFAGAAEAAEEAVLNALLQATATGAMKILPQGAWPEAVRAFQKRAP